MVVIGTGRGAGLYGSCCGFRWCVPRIAGWATVSLSPFAPLFVLIAASTCCPARDLVVAPLYCRCCCCCRRCCCCQSCNKMRAAASSLEGRPLRLERGGASAAAVCVGCQGVWCVAGVSPSSRFCTSLGGRPFLFGGGMTADLSCAGPFDPDVAPWGFCLDAGGGSTSSSECASLALPPSPSSALFSPSSSSESNSVWVGLWRIRSTCTVVSRLPFSDDVSLYV